MAEYAWFFLDASGKLPVVDRIHPQSNMFATGLENKATGDSEINEIEGGGGRWQKQGQW